MKTRFPSLCLLTASLLAPAVIFLAPAALAGNLNDQAQEMFNDLGVVGNVTAPQAFKGQTLSTYTGGTLFVRTPTKNYQLANLSMPYIRSGCGGIDVFGGSFSHISGDQFKAMLKNITSNVPGVMFDMMLKSVEPMLGSTMEWFKGLETMVNRANINSCETSKELVSTAAGKLGYSSAKMCENIAMTLGTASDAEEARLKCADSGGVDSVLSAGASNNQTKEVVPFAGNLVWAQMKKWPHLDTADKELIMSLIGTTIYPKAVDGAPEPQTWPPTIRSLADLLYGNTVDSAGLTAGQIRVKILKCQDADQCLTVTETAETMPSLTTRVFDLMQSIATKMRDRTELTEAEQNFIGVVSLPVYRLLSASNALSNPAVSEAKIRQYAEYVAVDFAAALLERAARIGLDSAQGASQFNPAQATQLAIHRENAQVLIRTLQSERTQAEARAQSTITLAQDIEQLERTMRANVPQQIADLLAYDGQQGGR